LFSISDSFTLPDSPSTLGNRPFLLSEFSTCFQLRLLFEKESTEKIGDNISVESLRIADPKMSNCRNIFQLFYLLSRKGLSNFDETKQILMTSQVDGNVMECLLTTLITSDVSDVTKLTAPQQVIIFYTEST